MMKKSENLVNYNNENDVTFKRMNKPSNIMDLIFMSTISVLERLETDLRSLGTVQRSPIVAGEHLASFNISVALGTTLTKFTCLCVA